jgi:hypothetical protein
MIDVVDLALKSGAVYTTEGDRILYVMSKVELIKFYEEARSSHKLNESQIIELWERSGKHFCRFAKLVEYYHGG